MSFIENNKKYDIIFGNLNVSNLNIKNQIISNDINEKYSCIFNANCEVIITNDVNKITNKKNELINETYDDYLKLINNHDENIDKWIYNIIDGLNEGYRIIYQDDLFLLIPPITWDIKDINKFHFLAIPKDKTLRSIRSLNSSHINLLNHIKKNTLDNIKKYYNFEEGNLKIFFHYHPTTFHLHIHFINIDFKECNSSVEYSHELDQVIFNLSICSNYYKLITLKVKKIII